MALILYGVMGVCAGMLGALVGLGGGILLVPLLTLFLKVPIHQAIAASLVGVVATSTTTAIAYVRDEISNIKLGMTLETATTVGAVLGGLTASHLNKEALSGLFGLTLALVSVFLFHKNRADRASYAPAPAGGVLDGRYYDPSLGRHVEYSVTRLPAGLAASFIAGNLSGLLGIGGGPIKVPAMTALMGVPMKAAAATSNFMIGVTACASAYVYYARGHVDPLVAGPVALGVTIGAYAGAKAAPKMHGRQLTSLLIVVLLALSAQMILAAFGLRIR